jgi:hypothetical protein
MKLSSLLGGGQSLCAFTFVIESAKHYEITSSPR